MKISDLVKVKSDGRTGEIIDSLEVMTASDDDSKNVEPGNNQCLKPSGIISHHIKFDLEEMPSVDDGSNWIRESNLIKI